MRETVGYVAVNRTAAVRLLWMFREKGVPATFRKDGAERWIVSVPRGWDD